MSNESSDSEKTTIVLDDKMKTSNRLLSSSELKKNLISKDSKLHSNNDNFDNRNYLKDNKDFNKNDNKESFRNYNSYDRSRNNSITKTDKDYKYENNDNKNYNNNNAKNYRDYNQDNKFSKGNRDEYIKYDKYSYNVGDKKYSNDYDGEKKYITKNNNYELSKRRYNNSEHDTRAYNNSKKNGENYKEKYSNYDYNYESVLSKNSKSKDNYHSSPDYHNKKYDTHQEKYKHDKDKINYDDQNRTKNTINSRKPKLPLNIVTSYLKLSNVPMLINHEHFEYIIKMAFDTIGIHIYEGNCIIDISNIDDSNVNKYEISKTMITSYCVTIRSYEEAKKAFCLNGLILLEKKLKVEMIAEDFTPLEHCKYIFL